MVHIRRFFVIAAILLVLVSILAGCSSVPEEYTKGVRLDRDYPEDSLPLMDDAIVYYSEDDNGEIMIKYGVSGQSVDDIKDFYQDYFDDNDFYIDEDEDDNEYTASGSYFGFNFKLDAKTPRSENEQKAFTAIVKIEVNFFEEDALTVEQGLGYENDTEIIDFEHFDEIKGYLVGDLWQVVSIEDIDQSNYEDTLQLGQAFEFSENGDVRIYDNYKQTADICTWEINEVHQIIISGDISYTFTAYISTIEDVDYMLSHDGEHEKYWMRVTYLEFIKSGGAGFER